VIFCQLLLVGFVLTRATLDDLEREFGTDVRVIVDGVTKLGKVKYKSHEEQLAEWVSSTTSGRKPQATVTASSLSVAKIPAT